MLIKQVSELEFESEMKIRRYIINKRAVSLVAIVEPQLMEVDIIASISKRFCSGDGPINEIIPIKEIIPDYKPKGSYAVIRVV